MSRSRIPYGIYQMAKAYAYSKRNGVNDQELASFNNWITENGGKYTTLRDAARAKKMEAILGRGAYGVRKFGRDFKAIVPKSLRHELLNTAVSGLHSLTGRGAYSGRGEYNNLFPEEGRESMDISGANDETQGVTITHSEYLQDIYGAPNSSFNVEGWNLNPGLLENFPWLAQMAANYEEYEFVQLVFHFKTTVDPSATNNSNGSTGTIIMATNYNPSAPNFTSKEAMMQFHGAHSGRVTEDQTHGVECDPDKNAGSAQKYVRTTPVVLNQDPKTFDLGKFQLAQVNIPSAFFNAQIGELWCTYTVRLDKPRLYSSLGAAILENRWVSNGGETWDVPFGSNLLSMQQNALLTQIVADSSAGDRTKYTIVFPDFTTGVFEVQMLIEGTNLTTGTNPFTLQASGGCTLYSDLYGCGSAGDTPASAFGAANVNNYISVARVKVVPVTPSSATPPVWANNNFSFTPSFANTSTITQAQLIVRQCNPSLGTSSTQAAPVYVNSAGVVTTVPI